MEQHGEYVYAPGSMVEIQSGSLYGQRATVITVEEALVLNRDLPESYFVDRARWVWLTTGDSSYLHGFKASALKLVTAPLDGLDFLAQLQQVQRYGLR